MTARTCAVDGCDNPMPTGDNSQACPGCWNRLDRDLGQMTWLVDELNVTITRQARATLAAGRTLNPEPDQPHDGLGVHVQALPFDIGASDVLEQLHKDLWWWVRLGLEAHPPIVVHGPARRRSEWPVRYEVVPTPSPGVKGLAVTMLWLHGWLQGHPEGHLAIETVANDVAAAHRAIDRAAERTCLGRCGNVIEGVTCDEWLYVAKGKTIARCATCGADYDVKARSTGLMDESRDRLVTTIEACAAVRTYGEEGQNITADQIRQWKARGRLVSRGHVLEPGRKRPSDLWLLGDVIDLATGT